MVINVSVQFGGPSFNCPSICRGPDSHSVFFFFSLFFFWRCRFFRVFSVPLPFSLCTESMPYVLSFRMVFFYLVTTGWIIDISLTLLRLHVCLLIISLIIFFFIFLFSPV